LSHKEAEKDYAVIEKKKEHQDTLKTLDELRRTRASRGGVGAPLIVPPGLRSEIILTDEDFKPPVE